MKSDRIHKVLANIGIGSRRQIEEWIRQQRIYVNGNPAQIGQSLAITDCVTLDGKTLTLQKSSSPRRVLLYNKPDGEVCSRADEKTRRTVFHSLPTLATGRWINIGRLDISTTGLLLFTNDGELAQRLMHPSYAIEREYAVRVLGQLTPAMQQQLLEGVRLEDGLARFTALSDGGGSGANHWYHVILKEGRNREVKRLFAAVGLTVSRLIRIRFGDITLPRTLRLGDYLELDNADLTRLCALVSLLN